MVPCNGFHMWEKISITRSHVKGDVKYTHLTIDIDLAGRNLRNEIFDSRLVWGHTWFLNLFTVGCKSHSSIKKDTTLTLIIGWQAGIFHHNCKLFQCHHMRQTFDCWQMNWHHCQGTSYNVVWLTSKEAKIYSVGEGVLNYFKFSDGNIIIPFWCMYCVYFICVFVSGEQVISDTDLCMLITDHSTVAVSTFLVLGLSCLGLSLIKQKHFSLAFIIHSVFEQFYGSWYVPLFYFR